MVSWTLAAALANEPVLDGPVAPYPSALYDRSDLSGRWDRADIQGAKATRMGTYLTVGAATVTMASMGVMSLEDEVGPYVAGAGGWAFVGAVPGLIAGPAIVLGGSLRSRRALKERGVRVSALPGAFGWTLYAATPYLLAVENDQSAFAIVGYGGAVALGLLQSHRNQRARRVAGLPDPHARDAQDARAASARARRRWLVQPQSSPRFRGLRLVCTF